MNALDRKLWRDLWGMRGQALAIALVIASGVATFVMSLTTYDALRATRALFYDDYRFADVFVSLKRAPLALQARLAEIPGVQQVETRVVAAVNIDIAGYSDPVTGLLLSQPDGTTSMNRLFLRKGRLADPARDNEVVVGEAFAEAHGFEPGDQLGAIINGRRETLTIVGLGLSAEYIYQVGPGAVFPDFARFGIFWMARAPLANAYNMQGAFNDAVFALGADAQLQEVLDRIDVVLQSYGGAGAYARADQISHRYLTEEFRQLGRLAVIFPVIFLGVATFLLNVVVSRLVGTQREQIAALKAFGYSNFAVGMHYTKLIVVIVLAGVLLGLALGVQLGVWLSAVYMDFYRFPFLKFALHPNVALAATLVTVIAAVLGTLHAVRQAALLPPAQAMRPEAPARYRESLVERMGFKRWLSQPARMIARYIGRRPFKALLTIVGISFAGAIMMVGSFQEDAVDYMIQAQYGLAQREDLAVSFVEPTSRRAIHELEAMPGVEYVEPFRSVPVRFRFEQHSYRTTLRGIPPASNIYRLLDDRLQVIDLPPEGVVLTDHLAKILGVRPGDMLTVEVLEGSRAVRQVPVVGLVKQYIGVQGYMELAALNRLLREGDAISGAYLMVDERQQPAVYSALKERPRVAGTVVRMEAIRNFYETMGETLLTFTFINSLLAGVVAFGMVYNSARIALAERSRELASLRVLGLTRAEISYILLGELAVLTLASIPLGFLVGRALCGYIAASLQSDLYRVPLVVEGSTYALAATVVLVSAAVSALIVRHRLDHLDLVAVLKTKE